MIKDVLLYFILFLNIKRMFSFARKICWWNRLQINVETIQQIMLIKYYNRIMNLNFEESVSELWNIYQRKKMKIEYIKREISLL